MGFHHVGTVLGLQGITNSQSAGRTPCGEIQHAWEGNGAYQTLWVGRLG